MLQCQHDRQTIQCHHHARHGDPPVLCDGILHFRGADAGWTVKYLIGAIVLVCASVIAVMTVVFVVILVCRVPVIVR